MSALGRSARPRALVVAYYFPPIGGGGVARTLQLVRALAATGWQPIVLTVDRAAWVQDPALVRKVPPSVAVLRIPNPDWGRVAVRSGRQPAPGRGRGRLERWLIPDLHLGWSALASAAASILALVRAVDVVYTTAPPYSAQAVGFAARALGVPWVADFRDAWTQNHARTHLPPWRRRLEERLEEAVLRRADRVVFASDGARHHALRRVPGLAERSETVLTGFAPEELELGADPIAPPSARLELVHAGSALLDRKAATFEHCLGALAAWAKSDPSVRSTVSVRFVGIEAEAGERIRRLGLGGWVRAEPAVSREALWRLLRGAHASLYLAPEGERGGDPIPGKLFDAVGAAKPLLALAPPGPLATLVRDHGLGWVVDPKSSEAQIACFEDLRRRALCGPPLPGPDPEVRASLCAAATMPRLVATLERVAEMRAGG
ncbi:MAG TPA: glycosyltransferase [Myxococcota bacterium]|nr:glycosyltransferase [Myxococcota bacterium]